jgi:hypothetical protein
MNPETFLSWNDGRNYYRKWILQNGLQYIRNVSLLDAEQLRWNNYFLRPKTEIILYFSTHENHIRKYKGRRIFRQKDYQ